MRGRSKFPVYFASLLWKLIADTRMKTSQKALLTAAVILVIIAIIVAVRPKPPPASPCSFLPGRWQKEDDKFIFTITTGPPSSPDRACDVALVWADPPMPGSPQSPGFILKSDPNTIYIAYGKDPTVFSKNKIMSTTRFAELNADGSVGGYKSKVS
jgi:hypothetical protein